MVELHEFLARICDSEKYGRVSAAEVVVYVYLLDKYHHGKGVKLIDNNSDGVMFDGISHFENEIPLTAGGIYGGLYRFEKHGFIDRSYNGVILFKDGVCE